MRGTCVGERTCALVGRIAGRIEEVVVPLSGNYSCAGIGEIEVGGLKISSWR
jgi:hypothetical protein